MLSFFICHATLPEGHDKIESEINKHSDISIKYEIIKRGRVPYEITFSINKKLAMFERNESEKEKFEISNQLDLELSNSKDREVKSLSKSLNILMKSLSKK